MQQTHVGVQHLANSTVFVCFLLLHLWQFPRISCQSNSFRTALSTVHLSIKKVCVMSVVGIRVSVGGTLVFVCPAMLLTLITHSSLRQWETSIAPLPQLHMDFPWKDLPAWHQVFTALNNKALINWQPDIKLPSSRNQWKRTIKQAAV